MAKSAIWRAEKPKQEVEVMAFKNVLIVDDSKLSRTVLSTLVDTHLPDSDTIIADSGESALEKVQAAGNSIDLAFIDYIMPGMRGLELAAKLQVDTPDAIYILCTANIQDSVAEKAKNQGLLLFPKPVTEKKFKNLIDKLKVTS